jgi:biotin carboxyl carrier protein
MASVTRIGPGVYLVKPGEGTGGPADNGHEIVYVVGSRGDTWAFSKGRVFRPAEPMRQAARTRAAGAVQSLTAPMPATIVTVLVTAGQAVKAGDTLVIVEAMKMELPVRAPADATVKAVRCREGEIVQSDQTLIELE